MAAGPRMELVGKRFVCVGDNGSELDVSRIHEWEWRAGVIRAVSYKETSNSELSAYVEFDDLEWEKREWVKVYEDFQIFLVEHQLVWAKRNNPSQSQGSKNKQIEWPALTFKSVVGKPVLHLLIAIEFFVDKQLNFIPGDSAFQVYQDDIDSLSPVLRDNPPLHEEVKAWVKEQKVQEIFMQGPYSLNGYRVRVYRQDSATQWFTGIITYHDLLSRTMIVMNDQVLEPQNVDPSMVQMTFLDDVVHSLLKGENIGITSRRRSRSNQNSSVHGHYTRAQANSPRLVMSSQNNSGKQNQQQRIIRSNKRKESDFSILEEDKTEDKHENSVKEESSKCKRKHLVNKRRKPSEDENQVTSEGLKTNNNSDTESSESENSVNKVILDSSSEQCSENELTNKIILDNNRDENIFQNNTEMGEKMIIDNSYCDKMQEVKKDIETRRPELVNMNIHKPEIDCQQSITSQEVASGCVSVEVKTVNESVEPSLERVLHLPVQKPTLGFSNGTSSENVLHEAGDICSLSLVSQKMEINTVNSTHSVSKEHVSNIQKSEVDLDLNNRMNRKFKSQVNEFSVVTERNNNLGKKNTLNASGPQFNVSVHATNKISKPIKVTTSSEMLKLEVSYPRIIADSVSRSTSRCRNESSTFQPFPARTFVETTRSPLIIDKNEHFTVYRDPALVGPEPGTKSLSLYLQPHLHPLHTSAHSTCLTTNCSNLSVRVSSQDCARSAQTCASNDARAVRTVLSHSLHSSHLLPGVLPGVPSPSLVCGHLDSVHARNLSPLRLTQCQQPFLQPHSSQLVGRTCPSVPYNQLGVYPVIWQYSNGTTLSSALSMASSKWIHPENSVSAEAFQRNASSPWLPQHTADDLGLLNHIPVRPASAEPHRPLKLASCSSPPLSKPTENHQKEKIDKKTLLEWNESVTSAQMKLKLNHDGPSQGMENQRAQGFTNTVLCQSKPKRSTQEQCDSHNKYKEESRRILQESIEVARLASTIKTNKSAKDESSRMIPLPNESLKPQNVKQDSETKYYAIQLHTAKNSVPHSVPQSNYFTTLSNSIINEPPQLYLPKDAYSEKTNSSSALPSYNKALSKPPPLIKNQPKGEGTVAKSTGQFSHQVTSQSHDSNASDHRGITEKLPVSSSVVRRGMPSLHRAPVHQHTSHQVADRKEGSSRSLSPPTLTPVLPVNAAKLSESQKPPTLLPEPRPEVKSSMNNHTVKSANSWSTNAGFLCKPVCHLDNKKSEILQMSPTSVIVRPPSIVKQESKAEVQCIAKDSEKERVLIQSNFFNSKVKKMCTVILPNMKTDTTSMEHERNFKAFHPGNNSDFSAVTNSVYNNNPDPSTSQAITTNILSAKETNITSGQLRTFINNSVAESSDHLRIQIEECTIDKISDKVSSADVAGTGATVQGDTGIPNATDYYHLKKHKAALAMAHSGSSLPHNNESASLKSDNSSASLLPKNTGTIGVFCKVNSVTNGQISQSSQPSFHTKLKKAWLTRHSEEDKNTCKIENRETTGSEAKEPITISSSASTTDDVDKKAHSGGVKTEQDEKKTRGTKRTYESGSESDVSDEGESKLEHRVKRQPKPTYKKRQNDLQRRKTETEREEVEMKPNGTLYKNAKEKKSKLQSNGLPRSVLKDWRKVKKLKQTGEPFLQDDSCSEIAPNLQKCRECRMIRYRKNEEFSQSAVFCRFYYFRRLAFSKNAVLRTDGFSTPDQYDDEAINLWLPKYSADLNLDTESSKYILRNIGDTFCQIETSEKTAMTWLKPDAKLAWKRAVKGVQEMCDACEATLFNVHWVCQKCGFVVCLDCYEAKERKGSKAVKEIYVWLKCVKGQVHDPKSLMPTQIIPGSVLTDIGELLHSINDSWKIAGSYPCREQNLQTSKLSTTNGVLQCVLNRSAIKSVAKQCSATENLETDITLKSCSGDITVDKNKESLVSKVVKVELNQIHKTENHKTAAVGNDQGSTLRDLLTTTAGKLRLGSTDAGIAFAPVFSAETPTVRGARSMPNLLDDIIASVVENKIPASKTEKSHGKEETNQNFQKEIKSLSLDSISKNPSEVPYSWLCEGNVLWLHDPGHPSNCKIFRECWRQEQPVLVSGVHKKLNSNLWKSESFNKEFADQKADLINCKDGSIISSVKMQNFWDGFEDITKRLKSKSGESLLLKLNDWPSGEDFKNMMPSRYDDFMKNLPLPQYCNPEGSLNLASRLPSFFIQPDLGPKLCGVYGRATVDEHGTTNLHLDVADVVNVLVYTGVPEENGNNHGAAILKQTEEEIDENTKSRLKNIDEIPGALWHIFSSKDTNKIREFLQKVNEELGQESSEHDPLHDQVCYLDKKLRQRLYKECGIQCRSILQFLGDTLLIPAGTLRQMQSIYSCIQVSEDFVSPEHIQHAFHLTHELRHQSRDEINYEDKLQAVPELRMSDLRTEEGECRPPF
ncbi:probable JmjC domain-containing histone demethylation protein 2C isoform X3 [Hypanus sabinus]|uniref:probable JmjC domain-containing histone demethylation protein 2C isoform X3 n=1 Tax=Hypanus sabinus TaxID=79690 RepID=UPI0028C45A67|nr:probable JmjC domain-containing histone demethylation protein 2C isoform X3 [Hypanus sabinus]